MVSTYSTSDDSLVRICNANVLTEVIEDFKCLLGEEINVDMMFICKNNKKLSAHQLILGTSSKFLYTVLNEQAQAFPVVVHIPDITESVMKQVLNFIYCGQILLTKQQLKHFYDALNTLGVPLSDAIIPQLNTNSISEQDRNISTLASDTQSSSEQSRDQIANKTQKPTGSIQRAPSGKPNQINDRSVINQSSVQSSRKVHQNVSSVNTDLSDGMMSTIDLSNDESNNQQSVDNTLQTETFFTTSKKRKRNFRKENSSKISESIVLSDSDEELLIIE